MPQHRVPTAIQEARGSFLRHPERKRARSGEPKPTGELGEPPEHMERDEKAAWRELAALVPPGVAKNCDRWAFENTVILQVKNRKGRANAGEQSLLKGYLAALGLTPADRSRVHAAAPKDKADDPLSRLLSPSLKPQ